MKLIYEITYFYQPRNTIYDPSFGTWGFVESKEEAEKIIAYMTENIPDAFKWESREGKSPLSSGTGTRYDIREHVLFVSLDDVFGSER